MVLGTLMVLGTNRISDHNSYRTCTIFGTHRVDIIIHILLKYWTDWTTERVSAFKLHRKNYYF